MSTPRLAKLSALALSGLTAMTPAQGQQATLPFAQTLAFGQQQGRQEPPTPPGFPSKEVPGRIARAMAWSAYQRGQGFSYYDMVSTPPPNFVYNRFLGMWDKAPLPEGLSYVFNRDMQEWETERYYVAPGPTPDDMRFHIGP